MTLLMPLNVFTIGSCIMIFVYFAPRIGDKQANWTHRWIVVCLAVGIFCIGIAPLPIWHLFSGGH